MALSAEGEELLRFGRDAQPAWFRDDERQMEELGGSAATMQATRETLVYWLDTQAHILTAEGPTATTPDWLGQHAIDRGTRRQDGETDAVLRERIRNVPESLHRDAILDAINAILEAQGITADAAMLELRPDRAYLQVREPDLGTGGTFAKTGDVVTFTPAAGFDDGSPPFRPPEVEPAQEHRSVISGAATAGNDGTCVITGIGGNGAQYTNAGGAAEVDATVSWRVDRYQRGTLRTGGSGRRAAYASRGYRAGASRSAILIILHFGATEGTRLAVLEAMRQKKAAGIAAIVEARQVP
jgi:hypothetical protein